MALLISLWYSQSINNMDILTILDNAFSLGFFFLAMSLIH